MGVRHGWRRHDRPGHQLGEVRAADGDVAPHVVGVVQLQVGWARHVSGQHPIAEARGEAFELRLDGSAHVHQRPVGDVAVGPPHVLAVGRPGRIDHAGLHHQHERPVRVSPGHHVGLGPGHLVQGPAYVHGDGSARPLCFPRDRSVERPVHLAHPRSIPVAGQGPSVAGRQSAPADGQQLARRDVHQRGPGRRQLVERGDQLARDHFASGGFDDRHQGVGDGLGAALGHRPTHRVGQQPEEQAVSRRPGRAQRQHRVRGQAGHQSAGLIGGEPTPGQAIGRPGRHRAESGQGGHGTQGRDRQRGEHRRGQPFGRLDQGTEQASVGSVVQAQRGGGVRHRPRHQRGSSTVERMGHLDVGVQPLHAVARQVQRPQRRRRHPHRVYGRAAIVHEPVQGEGPRAGPAADGVGRLHHQHAPARPGQRGRRAQPVGAGAHHHRIPRLSHRLRV